MRRFFAWVEKYERHLSAAAMVVGFAIDNVAFERPDAVLTQSVFLTYLIVGSVSIAWLHYLKSRERGGSFARRMGSILPIVTQFMLGGAWSAYLIFYSRSAFIGASWPFLLLLGGIFLGNEIFKKYHEQLAFTAILLYFALFSYLIFTLPILTHSLSDGIFLESGALSLAIIAPYLLFLRLLGPARFKKSRRAILTGIIAVFGVINFFYFTNILPPLPLALKDIAVFHSVVKEGGVYIAQSEPSPWYAALGFPVTEHVIPGTSLSVFSSVFAPTALSTSIRHRWEEYDAATHAWVTRAVVAYPITGGVGSGYRGYSVKGGVETGSWRVLVETARGTVIGQIRFDVATTTAVPPLATVTR
ncbi:MAG: DUF2914 domain-containing protein [Patescibacteria group bacterium]|nr:DUF2914 domain-containing protein [Patescibacteria group bacterium]